MINLESYKEAAWELSTSVLSVGLGKLFTSPNAPVPNCVDFSIAGNVARFERRKKVIILFYEDKVYEGICLPGDMYEPMIMILILILEQKLSLVERLELWEEVSDFWDITLTYPGEGESAWDYRLPLLTELSRKIIYEVEDYQTHLAHSKALIEDLGNPIMRN